MPDSSVRILQITDCHILRDEGSQVYGTDTYRSLRSVLAAALALDEPPQRIVATGDLSEDASDESYARLQSLLLDAGLPVNVIAGNHDSFPAMRRSLLCESIQMAPIVDLDGWRLVFLNSKVDGEAHGYLEGSELAELERALAEDPARPVVAALHHGPIRPCPSTGCRLWNDDALIQTLERHQNARIVLAGHAHLEAERRLRHTTLLTTPASSSQCAHAQAGEPVDHEDFWASHVFDPSRHGFRMLTLKPDGQFETQVHYVS